MPDSLRAARKAAASSSGIGGANHCLLFLTKICAAVKPQALARMIDCNTPPAVEVCAPSLDPAGRLSDTKALPEVLRVSFFSFFSFDAGVFAVFSGVEMAFLTGGTVFFFIWLESGRGL